MDGFTTFPVTMAYVLYEVRVNGRAFVVKTLGTANKIKAVLKGVGQARAFKRIGFLDGGVIFCTNGRSYPVDEINRNEQTDVGDVVRLVRQPGHACGEHL
jgi:hypothetical protein